MDLFDQLGVAGDANTNAAASPATADVALFSSADTTGTGDAGVAALVDDLEYALTVGQALERIAAAGRKPPSGRSMQRYCIEGRVAARKIKTVFGSEWLINESSLMHLIESEPIVTGDAGVASDTESTTANNTSPQFQRNAATDGGDASVATQPPSATPIGERRTLADVLIENARLLAQVEGRDAIIAELKEDKTFLREEVREGRKTRDDVKNIAERMLDTLKTMATGRSNLAGPSQEPLRATIIDNNTSGREAM